MVEFGRFGILAERRPMRLGGRAFDEVIALIEAGHRLDAMAALPVPICAGS